ncbi:MAG: hypothetical protein ABI592_12845 [Acidobacteriota bacterium]
MSAIGIESHSGWAALVVLAGPVGAPAVVLRRRVELADPTDQAAKQPFHAAEDLPWPEAKAFIAAAVSDARRRAREELDAVLHALASEQFSPRRCGIVTASGRALPDLRSILASHALIHAAEGEHFRKALAEAAESRGVAPVRISRKELPERAAAAIGISAKEAVRRVSSFGAALGPPWASDQKLAAMAAWIALR